MSDLPTMSPGQIRLDIGNVLGHFVDSDEPQDIKEHLTGIIKAARTYADLLEQRDQPVMSDLREAVDWYNVDPSNYGHNPHREALVAAAFKVLAGPSDEAVEAAAQSLFNDEWGTFNANADNDQFTWDQEHHKDYWRSQARAALEAVWAVEFGEKET